MKIQAWGVRRLLFFFVFFLTINDGLTSQAEQARALSSLLPLAPGDTGEHS